MTAILDSEHFDAFSDMYAPNPLLSHTLLDGYVSLFSTSTSTGKGEAASGVKLENERGLRGESKMHTHTEDEDIGDKGDIENTVDRGYGGVNREINTTRGDKGDTESTVDRGYGGINREINTTRSSRRRLVGAHSSLQGGYWGRLHSTSDSDNDDSTSLQGVLADYHWHSDTADAFPASSQQFKDLFGSPVGEYPKDNNFLSGPSHMRYAWEFYLYLYVF